MDYFIYHCSFSIKWIFLRFKIVLRIIVLHQLVAMETCDPRMWRCSSQYDLDIYFFFLIFLFCFTNSNFKSTWIRQIHIFQEICNSNFHCELLTCEIHFIQSLCVCTIKDKLYYNVRHSHRSNR